MRLISNTYIIQSTVNCQNIQSMPVVTFTINGHAFTLPASAYVSQVSLHRHASMHYALQTPTLSLHLYTHVHTLPLALAIL